MIIESLIGPNGAWLTGLFKKRVKENNVLDMGGGLTFNDVTQTLSVKQVLQPGHFLLQLAH